MIVNCMLAGEQKSTVNCQLLNVVGLLTGFCFKFLREVTSCRDFPF
mgnify:CR=1 FL=1